jgi:exopolysaccharide biosynthesis polyprenyl glycosylphosphotransferase
MNIFSGSRKLYLLCGDVLVLLFSLLASLWLRDFDLTKQEVSDNLIPFLFLFVVWILVFFIAGLYEKETTLFKQKLFSLIIWSQLVNGALATLVFYFLPFLNTTPKTILLLLILISTFLLILWREYLSILFLGKKKMKAILIGAGDSFSELFSEIKNNKDSNIEFYEHIDFNRQRNLSEIFNTIKQQKIEMVVSDFSNVDNPLLKMKYYELLFDGVIFVDVIELYEKIFNKEPLDILDEKWFIKNVSSKKSFFYFFSKRFFDLTVSIILTFFSLLLYPFVWLAIKLDDGGKIFITQDRVGKNNKIIKITKFRSMTKSDNSMDAGDNKITRVGNFLRKSRIDELPQLFSVIKGDLSLIGPRPEREQGVEIYSKEVSYYSVRHLVKPGLSGLAQIYQENHPHHSVAISATKEKLAYDLYYIKNISILIELKIALRTVAQLILQKGK